MLYPITSCIVKNPDFLSARYLAAVNAPFAKIALVLIVSTSDSLSVDCFFLYIHYNTKIIIEKEKGSPKWLMWQDIKEIKRVYDTLK